MLFPRCDRGGFKPLYCYPPRKVPPSVFFIPLRRKKPFPRKVERKQLSPPPQGGRTKIPGFSTLPPPLELRRRFLPLPPQIAAFSLPSPERCNVDDLLSGFNSHSHAQDHSSTRPNVSFLQDDLARSAQVPLSFYLKKYEDVSLPPQTHPLG